MLKILGISKTFGQKQVLRNITLEIKEGDCFGFVGPNGAGKTTLLQLLCGLLTSTSGEIFFQGEKLNGNIRHLRKEMGYVPQEIALYDNLTPLDNLKYFGELYGLQKNLIRARSEELLHWIQLEKRKRDKIRSFSNGMKRRINLIAGLLHAPRLLLLDEPTVGVDPQARTLLYKKIETLKAAGTTILYTSHYIPEIERLCNRIAVLDEGRLVALGTKEELLAKAWIANSRHSGPFGGVYPDRSRTGSESAQAATHEGEGTLESAFFLLTGKELRES